MTFGDVRSVSYDSGAHTCITKVQSMTYFWLYNHSTSRVGSSACTSPPVLQLIFSFHQIYRDYRIV